MAYSLAGRLGAVHSLDFALICSVYSGALVDTLALVETGCDGHDIPGRVHLQQWVELR